MWWLAIPAVAGAAYAIYSYLTEEEKEARRRWESKRREVELSIEEHEDRIRTHLAGARQSYDFHELTNMHFSCMRVADDAHRLMRDAQTSLDAIGKMIVKAKERRDALETELRAARSPDQKQALRAELEVVVDLRKKLFPEKDTLKDQRNNFLEKVRSLNARTRELKEAIRDRCGSRGREWYEERERRAAARKKG